MTEHFLGSPTHESYHVQLEPTPKRAEEEPATASAEDDSRESLRSLLAMLVPPRAFGRRHQQRTVNPLSQIVQTIDSNSLGGK